MTSDPQVPAYRLRVCIHAITVKAPGKSRSPRSATPLPVKFRAAPTRPATHVAPLIVPFRPLPELSVSVVPVASLPTHAPTRPGTAPVTVTLTVPDVVVAPVLSVATALMA